MARPRGTKNTQKANKLPHRAACTQHDCLQHPLITMPALELIDAHCHLDFEAFEHDREKVIQRANAQYISHIIIPGTQKTFWNRINQLCNTNSQLQACYGLHPYWLSEHEKQDTEELDGYIEKHHPVAVGECGLDFRPQMADKETQLYFFEAQLNIASNHRLPVVIHSVKATETVIQSIKKHNNQSKQKLHGMIHSFSGSINQAKQLIDLNFLISISASVTYDNAKKIKAVAKEIPLTSLLLETDAPDQAGKQNINSRNEPAFLTHTLQAIATLRNISSEGIATQTTKNAKALFQL